MISNNKDLETNTDEIIKKFNLFIRNHELILHLFSNEFFV
jgi:hypothetical protein